MFLCMTGLLPGIVGCAVLTPSQVREVKTFAKRQQAILPKSRSDETKSSTQVSFCVRWRILMIVMGNMRGCRGNDLFYAIGQQLSHALLRMWSQPLNLEKWGEPTEETMTTESIPPLSIILGLIALFLILGMSVSSCTIVRVAGTEPEITQKFGIVNLQMKGVNGQPLIVSTAGLGLTFGGSSTTLGWLQEVIITAPDAAKCRVFIVVETKDDLETLKDSLASNRIFHGDICVFSKEGEIWPK
jgi:hypothetical protein